MNYAKLAYLKATELEKIINSDRNGVVNSSGLTCFEKKSETSRTLSNGDNVSVASMDPQEGSDVCVLASFNLLSQTNQTVKINLLYNNLIFASLTKNFSGQTEFNFTSVASSVIAESGTLSFSVESESNLTLNDYSFLVLGASSEGEAAEIELKAALLDNKMVISFIRNGTIYYYNSYLEEISSTSVSFSAFKQATTHSVCFNSNSQNNNKICFAYVNASGELYLANEDENTETFVDSNVTSCIVGSSVDPHENCLFVAYAKNGSVYYKTLSSGTLSQASKIQLPTANYVKLTSVVSQGNKNCLIATDSEGNNFFCQTVLSPDVSLLFENINFSSQLTIRCVVYALGRSGAMESITSLFAFTVASIIAADNSYNLTDATALNIKADFSVSSFTIPNDAILYGVSFDSLSNTANDGVANCVYTDDAVGFTAATVSDETTPVYNDGGWDLRWPFNQLKPCLINNGVITYINDAFTETIDGTPISTTGADGDFYLEIPRMYYRYHLTDNGVYEFKLSNCKRAGFCDLAHTYKGVKKDKIYVAIFPTSLVSNKARSISNATKLLSNNYTTSGLREVSYLNGTGYEMMNLNVLNLLEMLFIIEFKSIDYKASIGYGYIYNSVNLSLKITGRSLNYPSKTYGYHISSTQKVDRFNFIEGFLSFAEFCIDGTSIAEDKLGFMNVEGASNNWIDDENNADYMFFDVAFPVNDVIATTQYIVDNRLGLFPVKFATNGETPNFDFFKSRFNSTAATGYRMHFPNLGQTSLGLFSYNFPITTYKAGIQGHRLVYYH